MHCLLQRYQIQCDFCGTDLRFLFLGFILLSEGKDVLFCKEEALQGGESTQYRSTLKLFPIYFIKDEFIFDEKKG